MASSGKPLNYTTAVPVARTVGEAQAMLAAAGAASVAVHYEGGEPCGLSFQLRTPHGPRNFTLPVNVDGVRAMLVKASKDGKLRSDGYRVAKFETREHAASVAWRVIKDWVEANLALIEAEMTTLETVMLPYLHVDGDKTLWQAYREREQAAIEAGGSDV
jgi:hypothetical protein